MPKKGNIYKIFFDAEFTSLNANADLISVGFMTENNLAKYLELEFDYNKCSEWVKRNILPLLREPVYPRDVARNVILDWLFKSSEGKKIQFIGDCPMYEWVFLCDLLFDGSDKVPSWINYFPLDLATYFDAIGADPDISRIGFCGVEEGRKHNALDDATVIKKCFEKLVPYF